MDNPDKVEYMLFPRLSALSEVLWASQKDKNFEEFPMRLKTQYQRYELRGVHYNTKGIRKGGIALLIVKFTFLKNILL
jgi:N-acetyl-beta-hexosaminidase